jgi:hypothetical protein
MTRPCQSCGLRSCDGVQCYLTDAADYPPEAEPTVARVPYVPSPEYTEWLLELEAKKRPDGRWEIAA